MIYTYAVTRWIREEYEVEVDSDTKPTREQIEARIEDPHSVVAVRQKIRLTGNSPSPTAPAKRP